MKTKLVLLLAITMISTKAPGGDAVSADGGRGLLGVAVGAVRGAVRGLVSGSQSAGACDDTVVMVNGQPISRGGDATRTGGSAGGGTAGGFGGTAGFGVQAEGAAAAGRGRGVGGAAAAGYGGISAADVGRDRAGGGAAAAGYGGASAAAAGSTDFQVEQLCTPEGVNSILRGQAACSVLDECNKQIDQAARTSLDLLRSLEKVTSEEEVKALLSPPKTGGSASQAATSPKSYYVPNSLTTDAAQIILDRMQTIIKLLLNVKHTEYGCAVVHFDEFYYVFMPLLETLKTHFTAFCTSEEGFKLRLGPDTAAMWDKCFELYSYLKDKKDTQSSKPICINHVSCKYHLDSPEIKQGPKESDKDFAIRKASIAQTYCNGLIQRTGNVKDLLECMCTAYNISAMHLLSIANPVAKLEAEEISDLANKLRDTIKIDLACTQSQMLKLKSLFTMLYGNDVNIEHNIIIDGLKERVPDIIESIKDLLQGLSHNLQSTAVNIPEPLKPRLAAIQARLKSRSQGVQEATEVTGYSSPLGGFLGARFERVKGLLSKVGRAWNELDILTEDGQIKPEIIHQFTSLANRLQQILQIAVEGKIELAAGVDVYEDMIGRDRILEEDDVPMRDSVPGGAAYETKTGARVSADHTAEDTDLFANVAELIKAVGKHDFAVNIVRSVQDLHNQIKNFLRYSAIITRGSVPLTSTVHEAFLLFHELFLKQQTQLREHALETRKIGFRIVRVDRNIRPLSGPTVVVLQALIGAALQIKLKHIMELRNAHAGVIDLYGDDKVEHSTVPVINTQTLLEETFETWLNMLREQRIKMLLACNNVKLQAGAKTAQEFAQLLTTNNNAFYKASELKTMDVLICKALWKHINPGAVTDDMLNAHCDRC